MRLRFDFFLVFLALLLPACMSTGANLNNPALTSQIEAGSSTKSEVIGLLGLPERVSYGKAGEETWEYLRLTEVPKFPNYIPLVRAYADGYDFNSQWLLVRFNQGGVVTTLERRQAASQTPISY